MQIDVAICTYNRPDKLAGLVAELLQCDPPPHQLVIVDAGDTDNEDILNQTGITYVKSNHKNQPYQRYIAFKQSKADILVYLDDDMEVKDRRFLQSIDKRFTAYPEDIAMALHFVDKHKDSTLAQIPVSRLKTNSIGLKSFIRWFTAYPEMKLGQFGRCGNRGKQPSDGGYTTLISGGAFAARRDKLYQGFNFQLFDLFEQKMGMGEDGLLGYTLSKQGRIYYEPHVFFYHNDEKGSHYAANHKEYAKRVLFSRLYLSLEKARLDHISLTYARWHYIWYGLWRLIGYSLNYLISPKAIRKNMLWGSWAGYKKALGFKMEPVKARQDYWNAEYLKLNN